MRFFRHSFVLLCLLTGGYFYSPASHNMGVEYEFDCNGVFLTATLRAYRDCAGATMITFGANLTTVTGTCPDPAPDLWAAWPQPSIVEITPVCAGVVTKCDSTASPFPGVEEHIWQKSFSLPSGGANCEFQLHWEACCRNAAITSGAANDGIMINSQFRGWNGFCDNNSPVFTNDPVFYICRNQSYSIHQGAIDPDGDSLAYSLAPCWDNQGIWVGYDPGYSYTSPLGASWQVTLDSTSGMLDFTPQTGNVQVGVICFHVDEYRNGVRIGRYARDMQVQVVVCDSVIPNNSPVVSGIQNPSPGLQVNGDTVRQCGFAPLSFEFSASDPDLQNLKLFWGQSIAGATVADANNAAILDTITGTSPTARFSWTPTAAGIYQFMVRAEDDECPFPGYSDRFFTVIIDGAINGNIQTYNNLPLANQRVFLIKLDTATLQLLKVDSTMTDANGDYIFCTFSDSAVYVKAVPDSSSYPNDMPTYASGPLYWNNADVFLRANQPYNGVDFQTRLLYNPGGSGYIGGIVLQGTNKMAGPGDPVPGLRLILWSPSASRAYDFVDTDVGGWFAFPDLPYGTYEVIPDFPYVSTSNVPSFTIANPPNDIFDSLEFRLHSTHLELVGPYVGTPGDEGSATELWQQIGPSSVRLILQNPATRSLEVDIYDLSGRIIHSLWHGNIEAGRQEIVIPRPASGLYFIELRGGDTKHVWKVVY